jgi:hypothetical protein
MAQHEPGFVAGGGLVLAYTIAEGTEAALRVGELYRLSATSACFVRFGSTAVTATDGGFDFYVEPGAPVTVRATNATIRAIRAAADGTLAIQRVDEGT